MKNKKAIMSNLVKFILWVIFFAIVLMGVIFLIKYITGW